MSRRAGRLAGLAFIGAALSWPGAAQAVAPAAAPNCAPTTSTSTVTVTGLPQPVPDAASPSAPGTLTVPLTVAGLPSHITDVDAIVAIPHTFSADLDVVLISPAGTEVTLTTDNGGTNDNVFNGTTFDDQAPGGALTDRTFTNNGVLANAAPEEPLAALHGEDPNGVWQLRVQDDTNSDTGSLQSFQLAITAAAPDMVTTTAAVTDSTFKPVPDANTTGVTHAYTVSVAGDPVWETETEVHVQHTFAADLDMTLTSPAGTVQTLSTDNGSSLDNVFDGTLFTARAGATNPPGPVTDATYANLVAETPLSAELGAPFEGENANGVWTLRVADDAAGDTGSLNASTLRVITGHCRAADLSVRMAASPSRVTAGNSGVYVATVSNAGSDPATAVGFHGTLPAGAELVAATPSQGTCTATDCDLGTIAAGGAAQVAFVTRLTRVGDATAAGEVASAPYDSAHGNDSGLATIGVDPAPSLGQPASERDDPPVLVLLAGSPAKLATTLRKGVSVLVGCTEVCNITGQLTVDAKTAKRYKLRSATVGNGTVRLTAAGTGKLKLTFLGDARKKLAKAKSVKLQLAGVATDSAGQTGRAQTTVSLKR